MSEEIKVENNNIKEELPNTNEQNDSNKINYNNDKLEIEKNSFNYNACNAPLLKENPRIRNYPKPKAKFNPEQIPSDLPRNNYYFKKYNSKENPYNVFIRPDGKPDFGNFPYFNDYVEFDAEKYKRPDIYFGFVHDQYVVPHILHGKNVKKKENEDEKKDEKTEEKDVTKSTKIKSNMNVKNKGKSCTVKSLDDIMNKYNLKYIEPPPKEKKVEPPPEEVPPEEEEEKDSKDKNKGKKESANKSKNAKDDKNKNAKPGKK